MIAFLDRLVARGLMVVNAGLRRFNRWLRDRRQPPSPIIGVDASPLPPSVRTADLGHVHRVPTTRTGDHLEADLSGVVEGPGRWRVGLPVDGDVTVQRLPDE